VTREQHALGIEAERVRPKRFLRAGEERIIAVGNGGVGVEFASLEIDQLTELHRSPVGRHRQASRISATLRAMVCSRSRAAIPEGFNVNSRG
jgi:hypothetical protein